MKKLLSVILALGLLSNSGNVLADYPSVRKASARAGKMQALTFENKGLARQNSTLVRQVRELQNAQKELRAIIDSNITRTEIAETKTVQKPGIFNRGLTSIKDKTVAFGNGVKNIFTRNEDEVTDRKAVTDDGIDKKSWIKRNPKKSIALAVATTSIIPVILGLVKTGAISMNDVKSLIASIKDYDYDLAEWSKSAINFISKLGITVRSKANDAFNWSIENPERSALSGLALGYVLRKTKSIWNGTKVISKGLWDNKGKAAIALATAGAGYASYKYGIPYYANNISTNK